MVKKNIKNTIKKHNLINADEHIVIGLSGGPDSVCLFSVLNELKDELGITLHAVHVNHGFRPGAAEEDQQYVEQLCAEKGVECTSFIYDCNAIAQQEKLTSEEAGRKVRYESFLKVAERLMQGGCADDKMASGSHIAPHNKIAPVPADKIKIAVAQNADDQAETVLFRLLRGTGTDGLAGIAYRRYEQNIEVIRPLLDTWRKDIEAYCEEHGLQPRTDHTNLQQIYTRNKIRLDLIPYLQENFNANIMGTLGRLSRIASEDKDYLWKCADEAYNRLCLSGSGSQGDTAQDSGAPHETLPPFKPAELQNGAVENAGSIILNQQGGVSASAETVTLHQQGGVSASAETVTLHQQGLAELEPAIRHRVVMKALQDLGLTQDVTAAHLDAVDSILTASGESKTVEFPDGYRASVRYGEAAFYRVSRLPNGALHLVDNQNPLSVEGNQLFGNPNWLSAEGVTENGNRGDLATQNMTFAEECDPACVKNARFSFSVCQNDDFFAKSHMQSQASGQNVCQNDDLGAKIHESQQVSGQNVCQNAVFSSNCPAGEQKLQKVSRDDGQSADFDKVRHSPEAPKHASSGQSADFDKIRHAPGAPNATFDTIRHTPGAPNATFDTIRHAQGTATHQSATFDADKIAAIHGDAQPVLRTRREGDYIAIKGGRKKLQNLFVDMKVPKEYRDSIRIIAVGSEILWLPAQPDRGVKKARYNYRFKLDADTKNCLKLEFDCEI